MARTANFRDRMDSNARNAFPLVAALADYHRRWPGEGAAVAVFTELAQAHDDAHAYLRARLAGHFTGSAWVVSADGRRTLLMHHRKLDRWLQPGGHADGDVVLSRVALREAEEETGLRDLVVEAAVFDLDRHAIPARGAEPEHWHYDVRFVVRATGSEAFELNEESHALAWRDIAEVAADPHVDGSVRRMACKWLARTAMPL
jgi:8-oxo-dGTP pyrophosphatase MutT (NUDIX family)